ncbi:MAG: GNAT family N-acetyltransferase [Caulobacteraceae bacterium]
MTKTEIHIKPLEPEDWPDVAEIFEQPQAVAGTVQMPFRSRDFQRKRAETAPANMLRLCANIDGKVIGVSSITRLENRRAHAGQIGMAVHDAYAGRGAGSALMAALLGYADNWLGLTRVELTVFADNARAIALYERFGFEREGLHRSFALRDGVLVDALAMARLRPAARLPA